MKHKNLNILPLLLVVFCSTLSVFWPNKATAREAVQPETVNSRHRPRYDPLGIPLSSFIIYPKLAIAEFYDDNIFATDTNEEADFITVIRPQLAIKSDWNNHSLNFRSTASIQQHISNPDENSEDFSFSGDGRLDILRNSRLTGGAGYARDHRRRSSPDNDDFEGTEPTIFHETTAFSFYEHELNPFTFKTGITFNRKDFDDVISPRGIIDNDDRDRDRVQGEFRIDYVVSPQYSAFILGSVNNRNYDNLSNDLNLDRSSNGYEINIGSHFFGSGVLFGELFVGYKEQDYEDRRLKTVDGITGGGSVTWQPTGLTTFNLSASRSILETTVDTASGIFETKARFNIDHELLRNLLLNLNFTFLHDDFEGIDRKDNYFLMGFGANYLINRYVNVELKYNFATRDSNRIDSDFTSNTVSLNLNLQL